jgi:hypothetical protein
MLVAVVILVFNYFNDQVENQTRNLPKPVCSNSGESLVVGGGGRGGRA